MYMKKRKSLKFESQEHYKDLHFARKPHGPALHSVPLYAQPHEFASYISYPMPFTPKSPRPRIREPSVTTHTCTSRLGQLYLYM